MKIKWLRNLKIWGVAYIYVLYATMRHTLILISALTLTLSVCAQNKQVIVDSFYLSSYYGSTRLLLSSDNTFFIAASNHTEASIARGKWTNQKGVITLLPYHRDSNYVKPKIFDGSLATDDTSLVLQIVDCFNRPVSYYSITLLDTTSKVFDYYADSMGVLKVNRNKFKSFFTYNEMYEFDFRNNLEDYFHPLTNNNSSTIIQLNYPKEILNERPSVRSFKYNGAEFIKKRKGLQYKNSDATLSKL